MHIETVLDQFHREKAKARPTPEQVMQFAKLFGSYVGEVYRKNHGGSWGIVELNGEQFPGFKAQNVDSTFWPWGRVRNRLMNGAEDNVWHYYCQLIARE